MLDELDGILAKAKTETRAFDEAELARITEVKAEIAKIDATIKIEEEVRNLEKGTVVQAGATPTEAEVRALAIEKEERDFVELLVEGRAVNLPAGTNGSVIPVTIANKIIARVKELSPLYALATKYDVKGALNIPAYNWQDHTTAYQGAEFTAVSASAGTFTNVQLNGFVLGSLALISKSLINRTDIDVVPFVVEQIAMSIANFLENELINGTVASAKLQGLVTVASESQFAGATTLVITDVELVKMKNKLKSVYQGSASWLMHPDTLSYIQTLKDTTGRFLIGNDLSADGGHILLGKPVMLSDNMPLNGVGKFPIFYGDFSALHVKVEQGVEVQVLLEKYAEQHALGVVAWASMDSKVVEPQKILGYLGK
jgi:HK97 family phage major capsid protein